MNKKLFTLLYFWTGNTALFSSRDAMLRFVLFFLTLSVSAVVQGSVVIMGTRVIYPATQESISIRLNNDNESPTLVQSWLDNGDAAAPPESVHVPFIVTPPVFHMGSRSGRTVRIVYTGESLPKDQESLFYLNVLDIPAKPGTKKGSDNSEQQNNNYLQPAIRSRTKFFFRPAYLKLAPNDVYLKVTWHQEEGRIKAVSPTPYYITYNKIVVDQDKHLVPAGHGEMISPFSSAVFTFKDRTASAGKVSWVIVNDYGGYQQEESVLE